MRFAEVKGERMYTIIGDLVPLVSPIADDPEAAALFKEPKPKDMSNFDFMKKWIKEAAEVVLARHHKELIGICAILYDKTEDEYLKDSTIGSIVIDTFNLKNDGVFRDIFF